MFLNLNIYKTRWDSCQVFSFELWPQLVPQLWAPRCFILFGNLSTPFPKRERATSVRLPDGRLPVPRCWWQLFKGTRIIKRASINENTECAASAPDGGSTENNDRKVGPRERGYTRVIVLPSPDLLRCLCYPLVLSLSVVRLHGNENELQLHPAAGALEGLPGPMAT